MSLIDGISEDQPATGEYVALARKWRPGRFADVVGQDHVVRALRNSLSSGRSHHAYLLTGTRGIGKTTIARILAKAFCCRSLGEGDPCGECAPCSEIGAGSHPDVLEMDAASHTKVDNMREILDSAAYMPTSAPCRTFIIDEVHMLSTSAFNAMLKTLEEPPAHVKFVLATTDPQKLPATVLSRCLQFNLKRIRPEMLRSRLEKILAAEGVPHDEESAAIVAEQAEGSLRDALSLLDQLIAHGDGKLEHEAVRALVGIVGSDLAKGALAAAVEGDYAAIREAVEQVHESGASFDSLLLQMLGHLNAAARRAVLPPEDVDDRLAAVDEPIAHVLYEIALNARRTLAYGPDPRTAAEMALLRMAWYVRQRGEPGPGSAPDPARRMERPNGAGAPRGAAAQAAAPLPPGKLPESAGEWMALVSDLDVMAKAIAKRCAFVSCGPGDLLTLASQDSNPNLGLLMREVSGSVGRDVKIRLAAARDAAGPETPGDAQDRAEAEERRRLIGRVKEHPGINRLLDTFKGATLREESIRPTTSHKEQT